MCVCALPSIIEMLERPFHINDDEVELGVVRAITAKLIDCKMDQMNQVVVVGYVLPQFLVSLCTLLAQTTLWAHGHAPVGHSYCFQHHISPC